MARTLTQEDAELVAAVVWETMLTRNGVTRPAREWLTGSHDYAAQGRDAAVATADNTVDDDGTSATTWAHWATDWATEAVRLLNGMAPPPS